jgi:hypothetical protein
MAAVVRAQSFWNCYNNSLKMYAICNLSQIPLRREPSDQSEMVSQLLFGELIEITEEKDTWRKVKAIYDDYTGWIDNKQVTFLTDDEARLIFSHPSFVSIDLVQLALWNKNHVCPIIIGSSLPRYKNRTFFIGKTEYAFEGNVSDISVPMPEKILEHAYMYLNAPYLWGGRSIFGIDCSGFTQMVFKLCGIKLKRDAIQQSEQGKIINMISESQTGDLAFFDNPDGKITHVGIILSGNHIIHASGKVRIDLIDHQGIFNGETKSYTHNLRMIRRNL